MSKNIFFFFQPIVHLIGKEDEDKIKKLEELRKKSHTDIAGVEFTGCCSYISATANAVNNKLKGNNESIDIIIAACDNNPEAVESKKYIEEDINNNGIGKNIIWVDYTNDDSSDEILKKINEKYKFDKFEIDDTVHIATNGGLRNNVMFFSVFSQILKYKSVNIKLYYDDSKERIFDVSDNNKYFDVLRGVELFTETGNPQKLQSCYSDSQELQKLFTYMERFYQNIQVCRPVNSSNNNSNSVVNIYKDMMDEIDALINSDDSINEIMRMLLPEIKKQFTPIKELDGYEFLQIVQWCYDRGMITIAYFILDAEITKFLYDNGIIRNIFPDLDRLPAPYKTRKNFIESYKSERSTEIDDLCMLITGFINDVSFFKNRSYKFDEKAKMLSWGFDRNTHIPVLYLHDLVRRTRNSMAHSDLFTGIICDDNYIAIHRLTDKYNKKYQNKLYSSDVKPIFNSSGKQINESVCRLKKEIIISENNAYDIYKILLKCILDDLKAEVK